MSNEKIITIEVNIEYLKFIQHMSDTNTKLTIDAIKQGKPQRVIIRSLEMQNEDIQEKLIDRARRSVKTNNWSSY